MSVCPGTDGRGGCAGPPGEWGDGEMDLIEPMAELDDGLMRVTMRSDVGFLVVNMPSMRERQAVLVQRRLHGLSERCAGRVAIGLAAVTDMNSAFINAIIEVSQRCESMGGRLVVFGLNKQLRKLFRVTGLDRTLAVEADCTKAIKAINRGRSRWSLSGARASKDAA